MTTDTEVYGSAYEIQMVWAKNYLDGTYIHRSGSKHRAQDLEMDDMYARA